MAEEKSKKPEQQPIRESVVPCTRRDDSTSLGETRSGFTVTNTRPAPSNPNRNGNSNKEKDT